MFHWSSHIRTPAWICHLFRFRRFSKFASDCEVVVAGGCVDHVAGELRQRVGFDLFRLGVVVVNR